MPDKITELLENSQPPELVQHLIRDFAFHWSVSAPVQNLCIISAVLGTAKLVDRYMLEVQKYVFTDDGEFQSLTQQQWYRKQFMPTMKKALRYPPLYESELVSYLYKISQLWTRLTTTQLQDQDIEKELDFYEQIIELSTIIEESL